MKITIICPECSTSGAAKFTIQSLQNDNVYRGKCAQGHDLLVVTQTLRHELLFEIALNAIQDGYYREAVASFAASIERFYEFATRVIARHRAMPPDLLTQIWKYVDRQSERQLGAFVFLYATQFGEPAPVLPETLIALRNKVIHKGELPDRPEVIAFGKAAYLIIQHGVQQLRTHCLDEVNAVLVEQVAEAATQLGSVYPRTFMVTPTALNIILPPTGEFESFIE